jgi:hypothetical protein
VFQVRVKAKAAVGSKAGMLKEATSMLEGAVTRAEAAEQRVNNDNNINVSNSNNNNNNNNNNKHNNNNNNTT